MGPMERDGTRKWLVELSQKENKEEDLSKISITIHLTMKLWAIYENFIFNHTFKISIGSLVGLLLVIFCMFSNAGMD